MAVNLCAVVEATISSKLFRLRGATANFTGAVTSNARNVPRSLTSLYASKAQKTWTTNNIEYLH